MKIPFFSSTATGSPQTPNLPAISQQDGPSQIGQDLLRGPALQVPTGFQSKQFIKRLNETGCYIHIITSDRQKIKKDLDKIESQNFPTPATHVGIAPFKLYNSSSWENCSGLVFSPDTASLLSHKNAFLSYRLMTCQKGLRDFLPATETDVDKQREGYQAYADYLSKEFIKLQDGGSTGSANAYGKTLRLKENIAFAHAKYQELNARLRPSTSDASSGPSLSSKFVIADILRDSGKSITSWKKDELVHELNRRSAVKPALQVILKHALIKIQNFDTASLSRYLQAATSTQPRKTSRYSTVGGAPGTLSPNEHLLIPKLGEIKGIYVNVDTVSGIDQALRIKSELESRQKSMGVRRYNYALLYSPSIADSAPISMAGWSRIILPWSSGGLIEFAETGNVTAEDGAKFPPNYFSLLGTGGLQRGPTNLASIRKNGDNLMHLAIASGRSVDVVKFFYFWEVSATDVGSMSKSAQRLAQDLGHPAAPFLIGESSGWTGPRKAAEKAAFIAGLPGGPR